MLVSEHLSPPSSAVGVLAGLLRGEPAPGGWLAVADNQALCVATAQAHGVAGLLAQQLISSSSSCPAAFVADVKRVARAEVVLEDCRRLDVVRVLSALHDANVSALILKGTALAYTHYAHPSLRPRNDTDLLVRKRDWAPAAHLLEKLGYKRWDEIRGDVARNQGEFVREDRCLRYAFDLHWQVSDRPVFAAALSIETLMHHAKEIPALGPFARTLCPVHALLLACMHRVRHYNSDLLIWLYDIHLLTEGLSGTEVDEFVAAARKRRIAAICDAGLRRAREHFHTTMPDGLLERLSPSGAFEAVEWSAKYLAARPWRARLLDVMTQSDWQSRLCFLQELASSDRQYLLDRYQRTSPLWLPILRARRLAWRARNMLITRHI